MDETTPPAPLEPRLYVEPLASHHDRAAFSCDVPELDAYLKQRASQDESRNIARVFVLVPDRGSATIIGYYTLSNYALVSAAMPKDLRKRLPSTLPLPATLLGRLAVHKDYQGRGLGKYLVLYALREALRASRSAASLGVVVDALTDDSVPFYEQCGFVTLVDKERHLIAPMPNIARLFPEEASGIPSREAILAQLQTTARMAATLDPAALDEKLIDLAEDLKRRVDALFGR